MISITHEPAFDFRLIAAHYTHYRQQNQQNPPFGGSPIFLGLAGHPRAERSSRTDDTKKKSPLLDDLRYNAKC
jgi:hypothetical protein